VSAPILGHVRHAYFVSSVPRHTSPISYYTVPYVFHHHYKILDRYVIRHTYMSSFCHFTSAFFALAEV
jgi:hypothetical protein